MHRQATIVTAAVLLAATIPASATVYNLTPASNWYNVLTSQSLQPGDEIILHEGTYSTSSWLPIYARGTAENPITIRAADGERAVITKTTTAQNNMDVQGARYLNIQGLEFTGASHAVRIYKYGSTNSAYVTIEDCYFHDIGGPAISCNHDSNDYTGMVFRHNEITRTGGNGEGFYLGGNGGAAIFHDGLIEQNYIHDLTSATVSQGDGIEIKVGSYNNVIRDNVIINTNYPGILVYGTYGQAPNVIERNFIWDSHDNGIQAAADAIIRNNIVGGSSGSAFNSHLHDGAVPGDLDIYHNTFIADPGGTTINISATTLDGPIILANNALYNGYAGGGVNNVPGAAVLSGNVISTNAAADFGNLAGWDLFPIAGSALIGAGDPAYVVADDFNGTDRDGVADAGAYVYNPNGNPGWIITSDFKVYPIPPGDANKDTVVNVQDLAVLATNWGNSPATWGEGNFNTDSVVNVQDLAILATNWSGGSGASAVPEPLSAVLLACGALGLLRRRRQA